MSVELNIMDISSNENIIVDIDPNIVPTPKTKKKPIIIGETDSNLTLNVINPLELLDFDYEESVTSTDELYNRVSYLSVEKSLESLGTTADLGLVFISSVFASEYPRLMPLLKEHLPETIIIGCGGGGVVGMNQEGKPQELEQKPAISLCLAHLPEVEVKAFHLSPGELPDLDSSPDRWCNLIGVATVDEPKFIIFADGFSANVNDLLQGLDYAYPNSTKVGGLASGGINGQNAGLFCENSLHTEGAVGVSLSGKIILETIVQRLQKDQILYLIN